VNAAADATPIAREYSLNVTPSLADMNLGEEMTFTATVSSENYAGTVDLALTGVMEDWAVSYLPSQTVTLAENQSVDVTISITVPTNGAYGEGALAFALNGDLGLRNASSTLTVSNKLMLTIEPGTGGDNHTSLTGTIPMRADTEVIIMNNDNMEHQIHSDPHGDPFNTGESHIIYNNNAGEVDAYCHIHGRGTGEITFNVQ